MYRIPELSSKFFTAFAWCDFILSIVIVNSHKQNVTRVIQY